MKYIKILPFLMLLSFFTGGVNAASVGPSNCLTTNCWTDTAVDTKISTDNLNLVYNVVPDYNPSDPFNIGSIENGSLKYADTYSTQFATLSDATLDVEDPSGPFCSSCFLLIDSGVMVDGSNTVVEKYLFDLSLASLWNGDENDELTISGFFSGLGFTTLPTISLYELNVSPVPVPAAIWLFGSALLGFIGFSRKTRVG